MDKIELELNWVDRQRLKDILDHALSLRKIKYTELEHTNQVYYTDIHTNMSKITGAASNLRLDIEVLETILNSLEEFLRGLKNGNK